MPRLTVALPLYRSARFLPVMVANLDILAAMPDVEVLVSDRHGLDAALDGLRERYGPHPRFRFFSATDGIDWVAHYNRLLAEGRGTYFAWMPHDDTFPEGYYAGLVNHLDRRPDTLLAFGPLVAVDQEDRELAWARFALRPPPWHLPHGWPTRQAYRVLRFAPWIPFPGVFRREPIVQAALEIRTTRSNQSADVGWVFGVGLCGPIRFVAVPACTKRHYPESTHKTTMPFSWLSLASHYAALRWYSSRYSRSRLSTMAGVFLLARSFVLDVVVARIRSRAAIGPRFRQARQWLGR